MGLFVWLSFETYWCPSEGTSLLAEQVLPGVPYAEGSKRVLSFLLRPSELAIPTKTNIFDASILLDLPRQQFLVPLVLS
eukprot:2543055-Alexandrium_andersonii.AAC.1